MVAIVSLKMIFVHPLNGFFGTRADADFIPPDET